LESKTGKTERRKENPDEAEKNITISPLRMACFGVFKKSYCYQEEGEGKKLRGVLRKKERQN